MVMDYEWGKDILRMKNSPTRQEMAETAAKPGDFAADVTGTSVDSVAIRPVEYSWVSPGSILIVVEII
jgi:hypothetical protein